MRSFVHYCVLLLTSAACLSSCRVADHYTTEDQMLLVKRKVETSGEANATELASLYQQEANTRFLGMLPLLGIYRFGEHFFDSARVEHKIEKVEREYDERLEGLDPTTDKARRLERRKDEKLDKLRLRLEEGNWIMRKPGEPPYVLDTALSNQALVQMRSYLISNGFFTGTADYDVDTVAPHQAGVTFRVEEDDPYLIKDVTYQTTDSVISGFLRRSRDKSDLKRGNRYDESEFAAERARIDQLLRNNGFYGFNQQYVTYVADTAAADSALGDRTVEVLTIVSDPKLGEHRQFSYDAVYFTLDADPGTIRQPRDTVLHEGVHYISRRKKARIPVGTLERKMQFQAGDQYKLSEAIRTRGQLAGLDVFKFVNMDLDTTGGNLVARLSASRLPKYQLSYEVGLLVSQGTPGPFVNGSFQVRNFLNGYEIFELSARYSREGQFNSFTNDSTVYQAQELGVNASLLVPTFFFPGKLSRRLDRFDPKTRFNVGYTDIRRPEYNRSIINANMTYLLTLDRYNSLTVSPINVNLTDTREIDDQFREYLLELAGRGNQLITSFDRSLITSFSSSFTFNGNPRGLPKSYTYFKAFGEIGGLLPDLFTSQVLNQPTDSIGNLRYFEFYKLNGDLRYYLPLGKNTTIASRLNAGYAAPIRKSETLPYEKFFFAGGGNSVRAYEPRRLGPGVYNFEEDNDAAEVLFEQPGEVLVEASVELRQKLFSVVEGALFVDAGNVWTREEDASRPGSGFRLGNFIPQLAVGPGVGLRFDFSFLIVRADLGIKALDPARRPGDRWVLDEFSFSRGETYAIQIGIGYPF